MAEAAGDNGRSMLQTGPVDATRLATGAVPTTAQTAAIVGTASAPRRTVGDSGLSVFPVAISGKVFGWRADDVTTDAILDSYSAHGGNLIDTADSYSSGRSEVMIGNWMRSRRSRDATVVATKVGRSADHPGAGAQAITAAVEASLRRLRTDRIDLLFLHLDDPEVAFEETLLSVDELIRAGKVRAFGLADHTGNRVLEARIASAQLGVAPIAALHTSYNLMERRDYEGEFEQIVGRVGLAVMPRFALASDRKVLSALDEVAAAHDAAVPTIALAWLLSKPNVVAPVVSAGSADQVFDLVAAPQVRLTRHEVTQLDRASEPRR
jgi:aryl-alcohol dehydrogenase-like predicted oxidoreductase